MEPVKSYRICQELHLNTKQICVYSGPEGVNSTGVDALIQQIRTTLGSSVIVNKITSAQLKQLQWEGTTAALVFGGGAPTEWSRALGEVVKHRIAQFVANGGRYLATCAGSYFVSKESVFSLSSGPMPPQPRFHNINLFKGRAIGPVFQGIDEKNYLQLDGAVATDVVRRSTGEVEIGKAYYQGGCWFSGTEQTQILATYKLDDQQELPAIIGGDFGDGRYVLSGLHIEFRWPEEYTHLSSCDPRFVELATTLNRYEVFRNNLWIDMFHHLGFIEQ